MMEQRVLFDVHKRATQEYVPPSHAWGESFPGRRVKALRQTTLLELAKKAKKQQRRKRRSQRRERAEDGGVGVVGC